MWACKKLWTCSILNLQQNDIKKIKIIHWKVYLQYALFYIRNNISHQANLPKNISNQITFSFVLKTDGSL